jgi:hypothetical protein
MLTFIIALLLASAVITFILIKKGKIADTNTNNIPDVIEGKAEAIKDLVEKAEEIVKKTSKPKKVETPELVIKTETPKPATSKKPVKKGK